MNRHVLGALMALLSVSSPGDHAPVCVAAPDIFSSHGARVLSSERLARRAGQRRTRMARKRRRGWA